MWATWLVGILARPWARQVAAIALAMLTITLFILNLRRTASRWLDAHPLALNQYSGEAGRNN